MIPIAISGTREMMTPKMHRLPRPWKKIDVVFGKPVTWMSWLNIRHSADEIHEIASMKEQEIKEYIVENFDVDWRTNAQTNFRLIWLMNLGKIKKIDGEYICN